MKLFKPYMDKEINNIKYILKIQSQLPHRSNFLSLPPIKITVIYMISMPPFFKPPDNKPTQILLVFTVYSFCSWLISLAVKHM